MTMPVPAYADIPDLLARANTLLNQLTAWDPANPDGNADAARWRDDYNAALPALTRPHGAVIDIIEVTHPSFDPNGPPGLIAPNRVEVNGIPLLLTEDGPVVEKIYTSTNGGSSVLITMTVMARRIRIDAEVPDATEPLPAPEPAAAIAD